MIAPRRKITQFSVLLLLISGGFALLYHTSVALAQNGDTTGVGISPLIFELNADPGDTLTNQIKIHNPTDYQQSVKMQVEDFVPIGEEGEVSLEEPGENTTFSVAQWTTVTPEEVTVQPGKQAIVSFSINVPQNAEPGGHYGSIVAFVSGGTSNVTGSSVGSKRGALVLLRVSGEIVEDITVDTFETKSFQQYGPVDFELKFKNVGNVHVRPAGFITITDTFGKQVAQLEIPQNNVIPDAIRKADIMWDEKNLMGRYTATVVANYGSAEKQTITAVTTFTVFPLTRALVIGGIVLLVGLLLYLGRKRIKLAFEVLIGKK